MNNRSMRRLSALVAVTMGAAVSVHGQTKKAGANAAPTPRTPTAAQTPNPAPAPAPAPATAAPGLNKPSAPVTRAEVTAQPAQPDAPDNGAPQRRPGQHLRFGIGGGLAAPMSSLGKAFSAGYSGGVFATGRPTGFPVNLRGDLHYTRFAGKNEAITPSYSIAQLTGAAVYDFPSGNGGTSPFFATAGLGLYRASAAGQSQTDFGQNLGLGFSMGQRKLSPVFEGRFHFFNDVQYFKLSAGFTL